MKEADVPQVTAIDREAFPTLWPPANYEREMKNGLAHYLVAGDEEPPPDSRNAQRCIIRLWDHQVGHAGSGALASAVSGAATVIGHSDGPPVPLPVEMPEKWCGAHGVMLALAECWRRRDGDRTAGAYDVAAADVLRAFCLQNSGGPEEKMLPG